MQPPWSVFPDLPRHSMGWRMGNGEDAYNNFYRWFSNLDSDARARYRKEHPEPKGWDGFYDMIESHPWILTRRD